MSQSRQHSESESESLIAFMSTKRRSSKRQLKISAKFRDHIIRALNHRSTVNKMNTIKDEEVIKKKMDEGYEVFGNEDNMQHEYAEPVVSNTVDKSNANFNENVIDDTEIVDNVMNKTKSSQWSQCNIDTIIQVMDVFYRALGLRINMNKSNLMGIFMDSNKVKHAAVKIGCLVFKTSFNYLRSIVGDLMSRIQSWHDVTEGMHTRLSKWKLKTFSIGGRLTLLKYVLGVIPIYHMSIFKVPMKVLQNMKSICARFFNGADVNSKKPSWVRWKSVLLLKMLAVLGCPAYSCWALMFKWVWRFFSQKNSLWVRVVKALHGEDEKISKKVQPRYPSSWLNIINENKSLKLHGIDLVSFITPKLANGVNTSFWDVAWYGDIALVPRLYALESMKNIKVASKLSHGEMVEGVTLSNSNDRWSWCLVGSGDFSVSSVRKLIDNAILPKGISKTRWIKEVRIEQKSPRNSQNRTRSNARFQECSKAGSEDIFYTSQQVKSFAKAKFQSLGTKAANL
nr:RNA-directed DNA polymerase, eukaryota, reverse transcriptase zinc-binding domain protein [Tanacetum cinerariifolium]